MCRVRQITTCRCLIEVIAMSEIDSILLEIAQNSMRNPVAANGDYTGEDGFLYCGKCNTPKQTSIEIGGQSVVVGCMCRCETEQRECEEAAKEEAKRREIIEFRREKCISDPAYRRLSFAADNGSCPKATQAARWYAENFEQLKSENKGLMFMGTVGTGKTFAACCIANELIERGYDVWLTTMLPLLRSAGNFSVCDSVFERVQKVDLLVLDDFGTTKNSERNLELLFEIVDTRARSGKPLIITTNLIPAELKEPTNLSLARIYDRVIAMCSCEESPVVLNGRAIRGEIARGKHKSSA